MNYLNYLKSKELFDITLGTWKTYPVDFELKNDVKPIRSIPYPVPKIQKDFLQKFEHLVLLGVLERENVL